jgi:hypothetical protein
MEQPQDKGYGSIAVFLLALLTFPLWLPPLFVALFALFDSIGAVQTWVQIVVIVIPVAVYGGVKHLQARRQHPEWFTPIQLTRQKRIELRQKCVQDIKKQAAIIGVFTLAFAILSTGGPESNYRIRHLPYIWMFLSAPLAIGICVELYVLARLKKALIVEEE